MKNFLVVGAGMRGIFAAIALRKSGHRVAIVDPSPLPGGVLSGDAWDGLFVDKGCHLLDFAHADSAQIYREILGNEIHPVDRRYASINRGLMSTDIAVPDMSQFSHDEQSAAVDALISALEQPATTPHDLGVLLRNRYGDIAGTYAVECAEKITGIAPSRLAPEALAMIPMMSRMRLGSDQEMIKQKRADSRLEERLAASSASNPLQFYPQARAAGHRNYYPSSRGMRKFCEASAEYMASLGIEMHLGNSVEAVALSNAHVDVTLSSGTADTVDFCYWSIPPALFLKMIGVDNPLADSVTPLSLIIYHFKVPPKDVSEFTYMHDYSRDRLCFRGSTPGAYGKQVDQNGFTYVSAEVPAPVTSDAWKSAESNTSRIWNELTEMGLVMPGAELVASKVDKIPVVFMLPLCGWRPAKKKAHDDLLKPYQDKIIFGGLGLQGKSAIADLVANDLEAFL